MHSGGGRGVLRDRAAQDKCICRCKAARVFNPVYSLLEGHDPKLSTPTGVEGSAAAPNVNLELVLRPLNIFIMKQPCLLQRRPFQLGHPSHAASVQSHPNCKPKSSGLDKHANAIIETRQHRKDPPSPPDTALVYFLLRRPWRRTSAKVSWSPGSRLAACGQWGYI